MIKLQVLKRYFHNFHINYKRYIFVINKHSGEKFKTSKYTVSYSKTTKVQGQVASFHKLNVFKRNLDIKKNLGELTKNLGEVTKIFGWVDQSTWVSWSQLGWVGFWVSWFLGELSDIRKLILHEDPWVWMFYLYFM